MKIGSEEREEMLALAASDSMRLDHMRLAEAGRKPPCMEADVLLELLNCYNGFLSHAKRTPRLFVERIMKL